MNGIEINFIRLLHNFKNLYSGGDVVTDTPGSKPDYIYIYIYRVSQEECAKHRESVP